MHALLAAVVEWNVWPTGGRCKKIAVYLMVVALPGRSTASCHSFRKLFPGISFRQIHDEAT
jgi:hypothetical protein